MKRTVSGARYGVLGWLVQRFSAVVMLLYTGGVVVLLLFGPGSDVAAWQRAFDAAWLRLATLLFALSVLLHSWVGLRDVLMDYVRVTTVRLPLQVAVLISLVSYGAWAVRLLWGGA